MYKNPRILLWLLVVIISVFVIGPKLDVSGMVVAESNYSALAPGTVVYKVNGVPVNELVKKNLSGVIEVETNKGIVYVKDWENITLENIPRTNIKFGLDIEGGIRAIIQPVGNVTNNTVNQIIGILQTRINVYGLREVSFRPLMYQDKQFIEIMIAGGTEKDLKTLLERQGVFEARIPLFVEDGRVIKLDNEHVISPKNGSAVIDGKEYRVGERVLIDGVWFGIEEVDDKIVLSSTVFRGKDIQIVFFDPQRSFVRPVEGGYEWGFQVQISDSAAKTFKKITQNLDVVFKPGTQSYLSSKIYLYLDNKLMDALNIASSLKGRKITTPLIQGAETHQKEAIKEKRRLQSILQSGSLPVSIKIVQMDKISPRLGTDFIMSATNAGLIAMLVVIGFIFLRYRKIKLAIPLIFVSLSEVIIILGMAVAIGWTIDLAAMVGIIAAVGTGVDSQIMILDEIVGFKAEISLREKIKRAFFMIFGAGGTTISAMLPLTVLGFGILRGFALTTILGVLIGIFITRPAFGEIVRTIV